MPRSHRPSRGSSHPDRTDREREQQENNEMYDMYPEWGPSRHRPDEQGFGADEARAGVQAGLDLRDNGGQRPDDN
jgi:hypothetical protein